MIIESWLGKRAAGIRIRPALSGDRLAERLGHQDKMARQLGLYLSWERSRAGFSLAQEAIKGGQLRP